MNYQDMILEVSDAATTREGDKRIGTFKVRVLTSPVGEMPPGDAVTIEYDDKDLQSTLAKLDHRELDTEGLIALGRTLAALLLPITAKKDGATSVREFFARSLVKLGPDIGLRVRLRLPPDLAVLPWEYAYVERAGGSGMDGFLALDPRIAIVRHELLAAPVAETALNGDIKVVTAFAAAEGLPDLDLEEEMKLLKEALQGVDGLQVKPCPQATLPKLQPLLAGAGVFHFAGHGDFTRQMAVKAGTYTGIGSLVFGDERIDAEQLGINLRGQGIRLAVLGGCNTGRRDGVSVWSGIAPALVKMDIPAVVANQYTITDKCAVAFSHQFYQALAGGLPLEGAVSAGRIAAYNADKTGRDWGVPVLYLRAANGNLFSGAADPTVRESSKNAAEVDVAIRAREVKAGGVLIGADVSTIIDGKLSVAVVVEGTVFGKVVGLKSEHVQGSSAKVKLEADVVGPGAEVVGYAGDTLGGPMPRRPSRPSQNKPTTSTVRNSRTEEEINKMAAEQETQLNETRPFWRLFAKVKVESVTGGQVIGNQFNFYLDNLFRQLRDAIKKGYLELIIVAIILVVTLLNGNTFAQMKDLFPVMTYSFTALVILMAGFGFIKMYADRIGRDRVVLFRKLLVAIVIGMLGLSITYLHWCKLLGLCPGVEIERWRLPAFVQPAFAKGLKTGLSIERLAVNSAYSSFKSNKDYSSLKLGSSGDGSRLVLEYDHRMYAVLKMAQCRGVRAEQPIEKALPILRNILAMRGDKVLAVKLNDYAGYKDLIQNGPKDAFKKALPNDSDMAILKKENQREFEIIMDWLVNCVGIAEPVLNWTLSNTSNRKLLLTAVDYEVLEVDEVKGGGQGDFTIVDIERHELEYKKGTQTRDFKNHIPLNPKSTVTIPIHYQLPVQKSGQTWYLRATFRCLDGTRATSKAIEIISAKSPDNVTHNYIKGSD